MDSIRLDRYFNNQSDVELLKEKFGIISTYCIPKTDATIKGPKEWKNMLDNFVENPVDFLREYFQRNQSESGFSEDKGRFGGEIAQRRGDRVDTAAFCTIIGHNIFWLANV